MLRRRTSCRLISPCLLQLGTSWDLVSFSSIHSAHTVGGAFEFLDTHFAHSLCSTVLIIVRSLSNRLDLDTPWQENEWCSGVLAHWAQALVLFAHQTLCAPCNLSCGSRFLCAFDLKPTPVLGRSLTISNQDWHAFLQVIASFPVHNRFQTCASRPYVVGSVVTRDPKIFSICSLLFRMDHVAVAHLGFARDEHRSEFVVHLFCPWQTLFDCATTLIRNLCLPPVSPIAPFHQSSQ